MDITIIANDTRGGVEPYLALAIEATRRGHSVRAAAPEDYTAEFARAGIRFTPLAGVDRQAIAAHVDSTSLREMGRHVAELVPEWARAVRDATGGTDLVVSGIGGLGLAPPPRARTTLRPSSRVLA